MAKIKQGNTAPHLTSAAGKKRFEEIILGARDIIVAEGYAKLRVRKLADSIGISVGHLQHFLPTKEKLLESLWVYYSSIYDDAYAAILANLPENPLDRLRSVLTFLVEDTVTLTNKRLYVELWSMSLHYAGAFETMERMNGHHRRTIGGMIDAVVPDLAVRERDWRTLQIAAMLDGLFIHMDSGDNPSSPETVETVVDTLMAIATAPPKLGPGT